MVPAALIQLKQRIHSSYKKTKEQTKILTIETICLIVKVQNYFGIFNVNVINLE